MQKTIIIEKMTCITYVKAIEEIIKALSSVISMEVHFATHHYRKLAMALSSIFAGLNALSIKKL